MNEEKLIRPVHEMEITEDWISLLTSTQKPLTPSTKKLQNWLIKEMSDFNSSLPDYTY